MKVILFVAAGLFTGSLAAYSLSKPVMMTGTAVAIDGDTIIMERQRIRLHGIDAPELKQTCAYSQPCGETSKEYLQKLIKGRTVMCKKVAEDKYGRPVATCKVDGHDLGDMLVLYGHAISERPYPYDDHEAWARELKLGIWGQQPFMAPSEWRRRSRSFGE